MAWERVVRPPVMCTAAARRGRIAPFAPRWRRCATPCSPLIEGVPACLGIDCTWAKGVDGLGASGSPTSDVHRGGTTGTHRAFCTEMATLRKALLTAD